MSEGEDTKLKEQFPRRIAGNLKKELYKGGVRVFKALEAMTGGFLQEKETVGQVGCGS